MGTWDDTRRFYFQALDATRAFEHRLEKMAHLGRDASPDYKSLAEACRLLPLDRAITVMTRKRDTLLRIVRSGDTVNVSRHAFLSALMDIAKVSGDGELSGLVTCAYVFDAVTTRLMRMSGCTSGLNLLNAISSDVKLCRSVRAEATVTAAALWLKCGYLMEALDGARRTLQLSRTPYIAARCLDIIGDIDMVRGLYRQAYQKYDRGMRLLALKDEAKDLASTLALKHSLARLRFSGNSEHVTPDNSKSWKPENYDISNGVISISIALETAKHFALEHTIRPFVKLFDVLAQLPPLWRDRCKLSIVIAEYLVETDQCNRACKYLDHALRMATRYENPTDTLEVFLISARGCWSRGCFLEAMHALRIARRLLRNQNHTGKFGLTYLIRAKVAFYRDHVKRAVRLALKASALFERSGDLPNCLQAIRIVTASAMRLGNFGKVRDLLGELFTRKWSAHCQTEIFTQLCLGLIGACYALGKPQEARKWLQVCRNIKAIRINHRTSSLRYLIESEAYSEQDAYKEATKAVETALDYAMKTDLRLLQSLCKYQRVKILLLGGEPEAARKALIEAQYSHPYSARIMWEPLEKAIGHDKISSHELKAIGCFLI